MTRVHRFDDDSTLLDTSLFNEKATKRMRIRSTVKAASELACELHRSSNVF